MPILARYGGELVAVSDDPTLLEVERSGARVVVPRFGSRQKALNWYHAAEYQQLAIIRRATSMGTDILIDGRR